MLLHTSGRDFLDTQCYILPHFSLLHTCLLHCYHRSRHNRPEQQKSYNLQEQWSEGNYDTFKLKKFNVDIKIIFYSPLIVSLLTASGVADQPYSILAQLKHTTPAKLDYKMTTCIFQ